MRGLLTPIAVMFSLLLSTFPAFAAPPEFSGGINDEYVYEEIVFLTGEPLKFTGTYTVTEREKNSTKTVTYKFKLVSADKSVDGKLDRSLTLVTDYSQHNSKGQTIAQTKVDSFKETLQIGKNKYELKDFQLSKSEVVDNRPASDFYSGNLQGRKYYTINRDEGTAVIEISGGNVGYKNFWGSTETQIINYTISVDWDAPEDRTDRKNTNKVKIQWEGTVEAQVSDSMTKSLQYQGNDARFTSFDGGYARVTNAEMSSRYEYNLPVMKNGIPDSKKRDVSVLELSRSMVPRVERLVVPKFRDIGGHWAQAQINKLYSLEVFDDASQFFSPDTPMTRESFIAGIIKACNIRPTLEAKKTTSSTHKKVEEVSPFKDVPVNNPNYQYIKEAVDKGIVKGENGGIFNPNGYLTKAQAVTILIRALGFENRAPAPGFTTPFADDGEIPGWAKDSVYMARQIGLLEGDGANCFRPNKAMTRAEASALLVRFLEFLEKDLQKDYRENIVLYK